MWEESIRLELLAENLCRAIKECGTSDNVQSSHAADAFEGIYLDLRREFPTLSQQEIWQIIGLCSKTYFKDR